MTSPEFDPVEHHLMHEEWEAWTATNRALRDLGKSWDDDELRLLHAAVVRWGETLAASRVRQSPDMRAQALSEANARYTRMLNAV